MKTIIYIGGFELPDKNAAAQRVVNNGKILRSLGYNVVYLGIDKELSPRSNILATKKTHFDFDCWSIPYPKGSFEWLRRLFSIYPVLQLIDNVYQDSFCGLICYNYYFAAQLRLRRVCNSRKALYIPDVTEWYAAAGNNPLVKLIKWLDVTLSMRYMHSRGDGLIVTSPYLADYYKKKNCKTVELPTLFDHAEIVKEQNFSEQQRGKTKQLVYAGNPFNVKNTDRSNIKDHLDYVVETVCFACLQDIDVVLNIYGVTKSEYLQYFPEHEDRLDLVGDKIRFMGMVSRSDVVFAIQNADFTVFIREVNRVTEAGFPTKFSESIAYGTPVLTNAMSNIHDYLIEGKTGFAIELLDKELRHRSFVEIMKLDDSTINYMKNYCLKSNLFDYRNHIDSVESFLEDLCIGTKT